MATHHEAGSARYLSLDTFLMAQVSLTSPRRALTAVTKMCGEADGLATASSAR